MGAIRLTATVASRGPAAAVVLDDEQVAAVGEGAKRFPVRATVNGYTWRTTVTRMRGEFLLGLNREVRTSVGVEAGDVVEVALELDEDQREVDVPAALAEALARDPGAKSAFDGMAYTHRSGSSPAVPQHLDRLRDAFGDPSRVLLADAKRDETRQGRVTTARRANGSVWRAPFKTLALTDCERGERLFGSGLRCRGLRVALAP